MTTKQAADYLQYKSDSTIRYLIKRGELRARKVGKTWQINKKELDLTRKWLEYKQGII